MNTRTHSRIRTRPDSTVRGTAVRPAKKPKYPMNKELIINVTSNEITIACSNKPTGRTEARNQGIRRRRHISVGLPASTPHPSQYRIRKRRLHHYLDLGPPVHDAAQTGRNPDRQQKSPEFETCVDKAMGKSGKLSGFIAGGRYHCGPNRQEAISTKGRN